MWTRRSLPMLFRAVVIFSMASWQCKGFVQLDAFIEEVMACKDIPGLALAVVYGQDTETRWYGVRDVARALPVDRHTLFPIGSLTKAFTSTLAADVLGDRDDVDWDTPIRKLLGDSFEMPDRFRTHDLCLRDVLAHKVGLEDYTAFQFMGLNLTGEKLLSRLRYFDERQPFRAQFSYSNLLYGLAGHVLGRLTNDTWTNLLHQRLTVPLGMDNTHTAQEVLQGRGREHLAQGYLVEPLRGATLPLDQELLWAVTDVGVSAGGVVSTAEDMARWMRFHLKGGKTPEGVRLVRKRLLKETHAPQMAITSGNFPQESRYRPIAAVDDTVPAYCMGWATGTYRGYQRLAHSGILASYNSLLTLFPAENIGIFTATNGIADFQADVLWSIHNYISDFALGEVPWLNSSTICHHRHRRASGAARKFRHVIDLPGRASSRRHARETTNGVHHTASTTLARDPLRKYAGVYHSPALGNFSVLLDPVSSSLRFEYGLFGTGYLQPGMLRKHRMKMVFTGPLWYIQGYHVVFSKNAEGLVTSLHVDSGTTSKPTFYRLDTFTKENSNYDDVTSSAKKMTYGNIFIFLYAYLTYSLLSMFYCYTCSNINVKSRK